jgi:hypothetical protein
MEEQLVLLLAPAPTPSRTTRRAPYRRTRWRLYEGVVGGATQKDDEVATPLPAALRAGGGYKQ